MTTTSVRRTVGGPTRRALTAVGAVSAAQYLQLMKPKRVMPQIECDARGYALGKLYKMGEKKLRQHVTKTSSARVGKRASWLRDAAVLRAFVDPKFTARLLAKTVDFTRRG